MRMAESELHRYVQLLSPSMLPGILNADPSTTVPTEPTGYLVDLDPAVDLAAQFDTRKQVGPPEDAELAEQLHLALSSLDRRTLSDPRLWQYLSTVTFRSYVLARWIDDLDPGYQVCAARKNAERFGGSATLNGVNRNAIARLFWTAHATEVDGDYTLTRAVLTSPELQLQIFDRRLCFDSRLARECVRQLDGLGQDRHRPALTYLRVRLGTVVIELLDDQNIVDLVADCVSATDPKGKKRESA